MPKNKTLLFEIEPKSGLGPRSFLFGTMHVRDARAFSAFESAKKAVAQTDLFAAEFDLSDADPAAFEKAGILPDGQSISDFLTPSVLKKLEKRLKKESLPPIGFWQNRHPMFLQTALTETILGAEMPLALDQALFEFARSLQKPTTGIETFAEQLEIFQKLDVAEQFAGLSTTIKNWDRFRRSLRRAADFYEKGDLKSLYRSARRSAKGLRGPLLFDRNEKMAARIAALAAEKSLFAAIGAGHLAGEKGVLRGLKKAGFRVRPADVTH